MLSSPSSAIMASDARRPYSIGIEGVYGKYPVAFALIMSPKSKKTRGHLACSRAASPKALAAREHAKCPRVFFDFGDMIKANATGYFPYTPSIPMLYGLRASLAMMAEEGLDNIFARHHRLAEGVRAAVRAWGLKLCAKTPKWYSNTVSAIMVPEGTNGADVIDVAFRRYNLALGAGLARMAGKLFRIGHLGDLNELMLLGAIAGAEMAMRDVGMQVTPGVGVAAAAEHYRSTAAPLAPRAAGQSPDAQQQP